MIASGGVLRQQRDTSRLYASIKLRKKALDLIFINNIKIILRHSSSEERVYDCDCSSLCSLLFTPPLDPKVKKLVKFC